jgi:murein DD-endopeptidase MepM/ murein hydrolase activator NlpD
MIPEINKIVGNLGTFGEINLNLEAMNTFSSKGINPLNDPIFCKSWVEYLHRKHKIDYSFGGYMENRRTLWRDSYLLRYGEQFIHLGIDINVPEGSLVFCPIPFRVLKIEHDNDQDGGWGTKVTIKTEFGCVIYAHLYRGVLVTAGKEYDGNSCIGAVGQTTDNGGWFPHLHIQGVSEVLSSCIISDGYSHEYYRMEEDYPNPLNILGLI